MVKDDETRGPDPEELVELLKVGPEVELEPPGEAVEEVGVPEAFIRKSCIWALHCLLLAKNSSSVKFEPVASFILLKTSFLSESQVLRPVLSSALLGSNPPCDLLKVS